LTFVCDAAELEFVRYDFRVRLAREDTHETKTPADAEVIDSSGHVALFVCRSCRPVVWNANGGPRPGSLLVGEVERVVRERGAQHKIAVLPIHCLARCAHSCSAAVLPRDGGRALFDELEPSRETAESLVTVALAVREEGARAASPERCPAALTAKRRIE
jgi:predicted metal-binding protein